jgi:hypothetical protein
MNKGTGGMGMFGRFLQGMTQGRMMSHQRQMEIEDRKWKQSQQKHQEAQWKRQEAEQKRIDDAIEAWKQTPAGKRFYGIKDEPAPKPGEKPATPMGPSLLEQASQSGDPISTPKEPGAADIMAEKQMEQYMSPETAAFLNYATGGKLNFQTAVSTRERITGREQRHDEALIRHHDAMKRLDESIRKGDIAEAQLALAEWKALGGYKTVEQTGPSGETKTLVLPQFGAPHGTIPKSPGTSKTKVKSNEFLNWYKVGDLTNLNKKISDKEARKKGYVNVTDPTKRAELNMVRSTKHMITKLIAGARPDYVGRSGLARSAAKSYGGLVPGLKPLVEGTLGKADDYAGWAMLFNRIKALERHEMFGTAFTSTEKAAFRQAFPAEIQDFDTFLTGLKEFNKVLDDKGYLMLGQSPPGNKDLINEMDKAVSE